MGEQLDIWRNARDARKEGIQTAYYGGSPEAMAAYQDLYRTEAANETARANAAVLNLSNYLYDANQRADQMVNEAATGIQIANDQRQIASGNAAALTNVAAAGMTDRTAALTANDLNAAASQANALRGAMLGQSTGTLQGGLGQSTGTLQAGLGQSTGTLNAASQGLDLLGTAGSANAQQLGFTGNANQQLLNAGRDFNVSGAAGAANAQLAGALGSSNTLLQNAGQAVNLTDAARGANTGQGYSLDAANQALTGAGSTVAAGGNQANATMEDYLARGNLNEAAGSAIEQNNELARRRLAASIGIQNRAAMGLARGQGESGALAMQQALASAGTSNADLALQSNLQQAQLASDMRFGAAQQQIANELAVGGQISGRQFDAAGMQAQLQAQQAANTLGVGSEAAAREYGAASEQTGIRTNLYAQQAANQLAAAGITSGRTYDAGAQEAAARLQTQQQAAGNTMATGASAADRTFGAGTQQQLVQTDLAREIAANQLGIAGTTAANQLGVAGTIGANQLGMGEAMGQQAFAGSTGQAANALATSDANANAMLNAATQKAALTANLYGTASGASIDTIQAMLAAQGLSQDIGATYTNAAVGQQQEANQNLRFMEGTALGVSQAANERAYQAAVDAGKQQKEQIGKAGQYISGDLLGLFDWG